MTEIRIAVVGARVTASSELTMMTETLRYVIEGLVSKGKKVTLVSGGCWKGPDQCLFDIANALKMDEVSYEVYLPDDKKMWLGKKYPQVMFLLSPFNKERSLLLEGLLKRKIDPDHFTTHLHNRNLSIINGLRLDTPVDFVYYHTVPKEDGSLIGGTAVAVNYAKQIGITCFNALFPEENDSFINQNK